MRKVILILSVALALFQSCSRDNNSTYYIRCDIDGTPTNFSSLALAHKEVGTGTEYAIIITGLTSANSSADNMGLVIHNRGGKPIIAGTYTDNDPDFEILSTYTQTSALKAFESGSSVYDESVRLGITLAKPLRITITSVDDNSISGTFTGEYFNDGDPRSDKKTITNGEFSVKFQ